MAKKVTKKLPKKTTKTTSKTKNVTKKTPAPTPTKKKVVNEPEATLAFVEFEIPISDIILGEHQPRSREGIEARGSITKLKNNIREIGLLQPILVQEKDNGQFLLISGERRYRSCKELGHKKIRAVLPSSRTIHALNERGKTLDELALFENLQRKNLTPVEEGRCFHKLLDILGLTQEKLGERLGLKQAYISERIGFLTLPETVQVMIEDAQITTGQARELVRLKKLPSAIREEKQMELAGKLLVEKLTLNKAKKLVDELLGKKKVRDSSHLTRLGIKKAAYFITTLHDQFDDINVDDLNPEEDKEKIQELNEKLPNLIRKLRGLKTKVGKMI